jgi:uncharacterized membrane protein YjfL (UPF0719 family)
MIFDNPVITRMLIVLYGGWIAIFFMIIGYRFLAGMMAFDICRELLEKNPAVGMAVLGMFVGLGIMVGLVVGLSLYG